jgi:hypothetical protein
MFCPKMGVVIGQVYSNNWIKKLLHDFKNWVDVVGSRALHDNHFV